MAVDWECSGCLPTTGKKQKTAAAVSWVYVDLLRKSMQRTGSAMPEKRAFMFYCGWKEWSGYAD
jgi:hypothetical protein